jgi:hypothetical protein
MKKTLSILLLGIFLLIACSSAGESASARATATASPQPTATALPTPSSPGDTISWQNLQVTMDQLEVTQDYVTEYDSTRVPPAGAKFLWVHIRIKNVRRVEMAVPGSEHFSVLYAGAELKPTYGHRQNYPDYTALGPVIFPDQELGAWLRFDIPSAAELNDLRFVFLPTSAQVGVLPSSPSYPYAENKPTYVWKCEE